MIIERWTRQPPTGYGIDWTHPLARGLRHYGVFEYGGNLRDLAFHEWGEAGVNATATQPAVTDRGIAGDFPVTTIDSGFDFVKHDEIWNGASELTVMVLAQNRKNSQTANENTFSHGGTGDDGWECSWVALTTDFRLRIDTGASLYTDTASSSLGSGGTYNATDWNILGGTWGRDTAIARVNTVKGPGTATSGTLAVDADVNNRPHVGMYSSGSSQGWDGFILFAAAWDRELTDSEWFQMCENPWCLREPRRLFQVGSAGIIIEVPLGPLW